MVVVCRVEIIILQGLFKISNGTIYAGTYVTTSLIENAIYLVKMIWFLGANFMSSFVSQIHTDVNSKRNGLFLCKRGKNFYEKRTASSFLFATATSTPQHYIVFVSAHTPHGMLQTSCARVYTFSCYFLHITISYPVFFTYLHFKEIGIGKHNLCMVERSTIRVEELETPKT